MENETVSKNFIEQIIEKDLAEGKYKEICTRFPPEPNGYLHIGHAKSILLNYGLAQKYHGKFNMRFDDTNPTKEKDGVRGVHHRPTSNGWAPTGRTACTSRPTTLEQMYECAVKLIKKGKAFVCDLTPEEIREYRGTLTEPGKESPYRNRSVEENLELFEEMKNGKYAGRREGAPRQDRYGFPEHQHAGSGHLPCGPYDPSQHRRHMVHLSDVRFCSSD